MITKEVTYQKAFEIKSKELNQNKINREMLLAAAYNTTPRLKEIDNLLVSLGANLAITALSGDTKQLETLRKQSETLVLEKTEILKNNQVPELTYNCPLCNDTGYVSGKICNCIHKLANELLIKEFTEQMPLNECTFDNFSLNYYPETDGINKKMASVFSFCKEYADNFDPKVSQSLLFMGKAGLGKTHLTLAIVGEVIKKGYMPIYAPCENLMSLVYDEKFLNKNNGSYEAMINCDLLVIDDLGTEMATSFTKSVLYNLINSRILSKKPTIINTNLTMAEIDDMYSPRVASRLIGEYTAFKFLGNDIRQQKILNKQR